MQNSGGQTRFIMGNVEMANEEKDISTNSYQNCLILSSKKSYTRCVPQYERNNFIVRFVFTLASHADTII